MIKVEEKQSVKLSGITSLFLSFPFNPEIITAIKTCSNYAYDKKTYTWELPVTCLSYLLDELTYIDDIQLTLLKDATEKVHLVPRNQDKYKNRPFDYQMEGIEWAINTPSGLLLDSAGLGKTIQIIYSALELKEQEGLEHCLIICGINTLKANWKAEIKKHSNLSCRVIGEQITRKGTIRYASVKERAAELYELNDAFFYIINIEMLRSEEIIDAIKTSKNKIGMIVLDEAHKCGNSASQQSHGLIKLKDYSHKLALTGTLLTNTPLNAYLPLKWIGVEKSNLTAFKSQYCEFGGFGGYQVVGYKNLPILKNEIESCSLRRTKEMLKSLPPKTVIPEILEMSPEHQKFYEAIKDGVKEEADKVELKANNVLALTTRLRQATTCPSILTTNPIMSTKIERAIDIVEEIVSNNEKVVIMSTFKEPLNQLRDLLKTYNPLIGTGDIPDGEVARNIELFQTDAKYKVFLGTTQKCGTGITLNAATTMICIDMPWTEALQSQVEDRIHRVNNTKPAFIYRLICQGTIDEVVEHIVESKKAMSDYVVDDKVDTESIELLRKFIQDL